MLLSSWLTLSAPRRSASNSPDNTRHFAPLKGRKLSVILHLLVLSMFHASCSSVLRFTSSQTQVAAPLSQFCISAASRLLSFFLGRPSSEFQNSLPQSKSRAEVFGASGTTSLT